MFDPESLGDQAWMRGILRDAVSYLRETFRYRVAAAVAEPADIEDLFLFASGVKEPRYRRIACVVLKVMHVINHIEGRDLLHRLELAEEAFSSMAERRVMDVCRQMVESGLPVVECSGNSKSRGSLITKLLAKKDTIAAQVYDRTRFRIVTRRREDILPVLHCLTERLFPFNLLVPDQTQNSLVNFKEVMESRPEWKELIPDLHLDLDYEQKAVKNKRRKDEGRNEFSGSSYKVLNFVIDLPLRIDRFLSPRTATQTRSRTVFVLCELQIIDEETAKLNEEGDNSHERYKHRQRIKVLRRLSRGLVVPRKQPEKP